MYAYKIEKRISLYKNQFDKFMLDLYGDYRMDRSSLELDAILFRMKYIVTHNKKIDEDKWLGLVKSYRDISDQVRSIFVEFMHNLLCQVIGIGDFDKSEIEDIIAQDVKIDTAYVKFKMVLVCSSKEFAEFMNERIPDDDIINIYPNEYFRFYTDSYNDAISKAYPELFENRHQDKIGTGADGDVFVHNFTFQTSERCSLNCFPAGTMITMADGSLKDIKDIKVGDMILGIPEDIKDFNDSHAEADHPYHALENYIPSEVTHIFTNKSNTIRVIYSFGGEYNELFRVTEDHPFLTVGGEFKTIRQIMDDKDSFIWINEGHSTQMSYYELEIQPYGEEVVYNMETSTHTYIANSAVVHNCTYCFAADTKVLMEDYSYKNIEEIEEGDIVIGCKETLQEGEKNYFFPTTVTKTFHRKSKFYEIELASHIPAPSQYIKVTPEHPIMMADGTFKAVKDIDDRVDILQAASIFRFGDSMWNWDFSSMVIPMHLVPRDYDIFSDEYDISDREIDVYNIETESHTYIANSLVVHNCYQFNKSPMRMDFETAKKFIDDLLADKYGYINRYNSPAIIIEFIGGEPLLEIKLTRKIYEYFLDRCYELDHPWFTMHRLSICSNGLQYFDEEVQSFFKEYHNNISFNISIDGNRELHDACRIQPNGEGSYDIDMIALKHYTANYTGERNSKMTLAPSNIKYLFDSVVDFINNGMKSINLNCVFEEGWTQETANTEYYQLKKLTDYILENDLENIYIAIFNERQEDMQDKYSDGNFCGGTGSMLAMRPNGQFYPCIRYMPTSVGDNVEDLCIGDVENGIKGREEGSEVLQMMDNITRRSQNNDICYECPLSNDCASCSALGHTVFGTPDKRTNFICIQMIAEALANVYYWNCLNIKHPEYKLGVRKNMVPDEWALLVIDKDELTMLKTIEMRSMITTMDYNVQDRIKE